MLFRSPLCLKVKDTHRCRQVRFDSTYTRIVKFIESESAVVDARSQWGRVVRSRNGELVFNGTEFQFGKVKMQAMDDGENCTAMQMC